MKVESFHLFLSRTDVKLSKVNYQPAGFTSLYDAIIKVVSDLEFQIQDCKNQGFAATARIVVITDGADGSSQATAEEAKRAIKRLRDRELIESSMIIGLHDPDFTDVCWKSLERQSA